MKQSQEESEWRKFWDEFSKDGYDYVALLPENKSMLERVAGIVGKNKLVLDAGCGTGNLTLKLSRHNKVIGVDFSHEMLGIASEKSSKNGGISLRHGNVMELPFEDCIFDAVVSVNVLFNIKYPEKAISEAFRVLKKNGVFVISTPSKDAAFTPEFLERVSQDSARGNVDIEKMQKLALYNRMLFDGNGMKFRPSDNEMSCLLVSNGFAIKKQERIYYDSNILIEAIKIRE